MKVRPPKLAQRLFSWYCRNQLHDSILGDLEEQFHQNQTRFGFRKSQFIFWLGVLQFMNRHTLKRNRQADTHHYYSTSMVKHHLISSLRFLRRHKRFTFINIFGLVLGFTSIMLILVFVDHERSFDQFHVDGEQVYRINFSFQDQAGNVTTLVNSPPALAKGVDGKFPELQKISRMRYAMNCLLANGEVSFYEDHGYYADSMFLKILPFELLFGSESALDEPNAIVITETQALKYFNNPNPIGATLLFNNTIPLKVTGILADLPSNSHLDFNFLISFPTYIVPEGYASDLTSWSWLGFLTYIELAPNVDSKGFEDKLAQHFKDLNPENPNPMLPIVQPLADIYLGSQGMTDDLASHIRTGNRFSVDVLLMVAILIVIIAGFNFTNLNYALSVNRSKGTGIRKVLGAGKKGIIAQLLTESLLLICICLLISFGLSFYLFPSLSQFMGWEFSLGIAEVLKLAPIMMIAGALIGILSGIYPSLLLIRFDAIKSIRGTFKSAKGNPFQLKNVLVIVQFAISIGFISATIVMNQQINYLARWDTGYDSEQVVVIKMLPEEMSANYEVYKQKLEQHASVTSVSRSERVMGEPWPWSVILKSGDSPENGKRVFFNQVDYDYFQSLGIPISQGRSFSKEHVTDPTRSIIINQQAASLLRLKNPIGQQVHFFELDGPRAIVGVMEDFNYTSLHQEIGPAVVILPFIDLDHMYVRFAPGNLQTQIGMMEETWKQVAPGAPLAWQFMDDDLDRLYRSEEKLSFMIQVFAALTILLACLGLFGIVTFMINNRIKEVGIRKVLGASMQSLYVLFVRKYLYQTLLALVIISPFIHQLLNTWLENFAYHIQISWLIYPLAAVGMLVMILFTISFQTIRAARTNPTLLLRDE